jgi:hypothetical protein
VSGRLWKLEEFPFHPEKLKYYETIFTIGNGYLAARGSFEEGYDGDSPVTLVHGIFDHAPNVLVPELVNVPNWLPIRIWIDGTPFKLVNQNDTTLNPPDGAVIGYRRTLHLNQGLLRREVLFRAASGAIVRLVFERFASLHDVHVLAQRVQLIPVDGTPEIRVESGIDTEVTNNGAVHWLPDTHAVANRDLLSVEVTAGQSGYVLGMASKMLCDADEDLMPGVENGSPRATMQFDRSTSSWRFLPAAILIHLLTPPARKSMRPRASAMHSYLQTMSPNGTTIGTAAMWKLKATTLLNWRSASPNITS